MYLLYRSRHLISWLPAIVIGGCILLVSRQAVLQVTPHYDDSAIVLSLAEPEPPAPAPEPEPESPPPEPIPQPQPEPEPIEAPVVEEQVPVIAPKPVVKPQPKPKPKPVVKPQPKPKPKPVVKNPPKPQPAVTPSRAPVSSAPSPSSPPVAKVNTQALENSYLQALRSELEQRKRYPNGRQASLERPEGNVEVWLEIDRSGKVLASGISHKAPSMLLNRAALGSLQSISQVRSFPEEAFAGQRTKRFTATFNYQAP